MSGDEPETDPSAPTRQRVARSILEHGPSTAAELATRLGLTAAGVRRHLDGLAEQGLLTSREQRVYGARGRGRPARVFVLTDAGRDSFGAGYDDLAVQALEFLAATAGARMRSAASPQARIAPLEEHYRQALAARRRDRDPGADPGPDALGRGLRRLRSGRPSPGSSCASTTARSPTWPSAFPQLCEAETEAFSRQLGVHVQRLATIAHGDGVCTTHIPRTTRHGRRRRRRIPAPTSHAPTGTSGSGRGLEPSSTPPTTRSTRYDRHP